MSQRNDDGLDIGAALELAEEVMDQLNGKPARSRRRRPSNKRLGWKEFLLALFLIFGLWAFQELTGGEKPLYEPPPVESNGTITVYFTFPRYPDNSTPHEGSIDATLAAAIDEAKESVDVAAFELNLPSVTRALVEASKRGVRVRLVTDSDYADDLGPETLQEHSIPVVFDERDAFMHDKFVIIDGEQVWAGSWNLTDNGTYRNNNNVVVINSAAIAQDYTTEFEEMFSEHSFGPNSPANTPYPVVDVGGTEVEVYFSPEDNVERHLIPVIENARTSIYFLAFTFTDDDLAKAIVDRYRHGVEVEGVIEKRNIDNSGSDYEAMREAGINVLPDGNPYVMHHKVMIIDEAIVVTGSYNFSSSASRSNDENLLIIHSPELAAKYLEEFRKIQQQAEAAQ